MAARMAPDTCRKDAATGESCAWYHGFWQYLRLLGIGTDPRDHADFFHGALEAALRQPRCRILVSGAADYGTLAQVLWACRRAGTGADVTVVDICPTPIHLCRWYAKFVGTEVATQVSDILDYESPEAFDVICTHSFLGFFAPAVRPRLMARWHALLRPGGRCIAVNRIRGADADDVTLFTPEQARALRDRVLGEAAKRPSLGLDPARLAASVQTYAERKASFPVRSGEEMTQLFSANGFAIERFEAASLEPKARGAQGPTIRGSTPYGMIVAVRP